MKINKFRIAPFASTVFILLFFVLFPYIGCKMNKSSESYAVVEAKIIRVTPGSIFIDFPDDRKPMSQFEIDALIIRGDYKGESVCFTFLKSSPLAALDSGDIIVFHIDRKHLEKHIKDLKNIIKAYSRLIDNDIKVVSIVKTSSR